MRIVSAALSARRPLSVVCGAAFAFQPAWADQSARDSTADSSLTDDAVSPLTNANTLQAVSVNAIRPAFAPDTPAVVETITRSQIDARNIVDTEDALKYAPNLMVRKRFTGDRNSVFAGRDFNELQSAHGLVYADGLLLSNLLGSSYAHWENHYTDRGQTFLSNAAGNPVYASNVTIGG